MASPTAERTGEAPSAEPEEREPSSARRWGRALRRLAGAMVEEFKTDRVSTLAAGVAFYGVLSLFPAILVLASSLGFLEVFVGQALATRAQDAVIDVLERSLTSEASDVTTTVQSLFTEARPDVFTFSLVLSLWSASRGFGAVIDALDTVYDLEERRGVVERRLIAFLMAIATALVATLTLAMVVVGPLFGTGEDLADGLGLGQAFVTAWEWARWPFVIALLVAWAATVLHFGPNHRTPWRWDVPGALLTTVLWMLMTLVFRFYLSSLGGDDVLGFLGGALIVLVWIYLLAFGLLLGGELNAILASHYDVPQTLRSGGPEEHARRWFDRARAKVRSWTSS